jgi:P-type conjugative transfer ATPase TrbB
MIISDCCSRYGGRMSGQSSSMEQLTAESRRRISAKLQDELGEVICTTLMEPDVVEVMVNPDGSLWVERLGKGMTQIEEDGQVSPARVIATVAAYADTVVTRQSPIVSAVLPTDGSRFEGLLPPIVAGPTFTIRRKASKVFGLEDYASNSIMTSSDIMVLRTAVVERRNIMIAGGTGSGKTTLANALIQEISLIHPEHRIVIIEDTAEIQCSAHNKVQMLTSDEVGMDRLLRSTMRLRPDRIIVGEVRGGEALTLLKAWNTGHPGGIGTIHANSARAALDRLESLIDESTASPMRRLIGEALDMVLFITNENGKRRISEILEVTNSDGDTYRTKSFTRREEQHAA